MGSRDPHIARSAPHGGVRHGGLIRLWNRLIVGSGAHILVHGRRTREELIGGGLA